MEHSPSVAIVILNWNGISLFREFLPSVLNNSRQAGIRIYVADNGSTDGSVEFLNENFPEVKIIRLDKNYGFAGGYNRALTQISADYFVLINSDVEVTPGWLEPCIRILQEEPSTAAVQPLILSYTNKDKFEYAGAAGGFIDHWGFPFCRGRVLSEVESDKGQYDHPVSIFWATGACLFIRASLFREVGGFDEDFFAHMEEIDLCWRIKNRGWKIMVEPRSRVYHLGGATLSYQSPKKVYLNFRNSLWMLMKNLPPGKVFPILFIRLTLDGAAAAMFLVTGKFRATAAVLNSHMSFYRHFFTFLKKRKELLPLVKSKTHPEIYPFSMVWRFYILKKRTFTELVSSGKKL